MGAASAGSPALAAGVRRCASREDVMLGIPELRRPVLVILTALALGLAMPAPLLAQTTPPSTATPMPGTTETYPVAIHQGTCAQPTAEPADQIGELRGFIDQTNQVIPQTNFRGQPTSALLTSGIGVAPKLDDLLGATPYVLLVHKSAQDYATYLACGAIGGPVVNDQLVVAVRPLNGSDLAGVAILTRANPGLGGSKNNTTGNIYLLHLTPGGGTGQAISSPSPGLELTGTPVG
jgi:hypothetical protein